MLKFNKKLHCRHGEETRNDMHTLYGDGIHDDTLAIQELIDSGACEVILPAPKNFYLISKPLELHSNFRLVLPRFAEVRLAAGSNCVMPLPPPAFTAVRSVRWKPSAFSRQRG